MRKRIKELINRYLKKETTSSQAQPFRGLWLPMKRSNENLANNQTYLESAVEQVDELSQYCELNSGTHILDFGCGQGRFANGLLANTTSIGSYCGVDTNRDSILWCNHWIHCYHPAFSFIFVPARNERYNPSGEPRLSIPIRSNSKDVVFMNSVFSHMLTEDVRYYLKELYKTMRNDGVLYTTAFIEENVPEVEENPKNYLGKKSSGRLHRVRYEKSFFLSILDQSSFRIIDFKHQKIERTKQSVIVARKVA